MSVCVSNGSVHSAVRFAQKQRTISAKLSIAAACKLSEPNVKYENAKQASTQQQQRLQQQQQHSDQAHLFDTKTITKKKRKRKKVAKEKSKRLQCVCGCVCVCFAKRQFFAQFAITHSSSHSIAVRRRSLIECLPAGEREREHKNYACLARGLSLSRDAPTRSSSAEHTLSLAVVLSLVAGGAGRDESSSSSSSYKLSAALAFHSFVSGTLTLVQASSAVKFASSFSVCTS